MNSKTFFLSLLASLSSQVGDVQVYCHFKITCLSSCRTDSKMLVWSLHRTASRLTMSLSVNEFKHQNTNIYKLAEL